MNGRLYTVSFDNVTVSAAQDLIAIKPADDKPCMLAGFTIDNVGGVADAGDAQEELLRCIVRRGYATDGSGGTAATPRPVISTAAAAGFTARVNDTTPASAGTPIDLWPFGWNVRVPAREFFAEEFMFTHSQVDTLLVIRLVTAPADALSVSGCAWVCELG